MCYTFENVIRRGPLDFSKKWRKLNGGQKSGFRLFINDLFFLFDDLQDAETERRPVTVVVGNESCDLDSAVSAIVLAYFLHTRQSPGEKEKIIVPGLTTAITQFKSYFSCFFKTVEMATCDHSERFCLFTFHHVKRAWTDYVCVNDCVQRCNVYIFAFGKGGFANVLLRQRSGKQLV